MLIFERKNKVANFKCLTETAVRKLSLCVVLLAVEGVVHFMALAAVLRQSTKLTLSQISKFWQTYVRWDVGKYNFCSELRILAFNVGSKSS